MTIGVRRAGVLGDVHGEDEALAQALERLAALEVDEIWCVGDIVDGPGDVQHCISLLRDAGVRTVAGNHERWYLAGEQRGVPHATRDLPQEAHAYISGLAATERIATVAGTALLCHGVGDDDMATLFPDTRGYALQAIAPLRPMMLDPELAFVVGGHTHVPMVRQFPGLCVVNAGTLRRGDDPCFNVLDFAALEVDRYSLDGKSAPPRREPLLLPGPLE